MLMLQKTGEVRRKRRTEGKKENILSFKEKKKQIKVTEIFLSTKLKRLM